MKESQNMLVWGGGRPAFLHSIGGWQKAQQSLTPVVDWLDGLLPWSRWVAITSLAPFAVAVAVSVRLGKLCGHSSSYPTGKPQNWWDQFYAQELQSCYAPASCHAHGYSLCNTYWLGGGWIQSASQSYMYAMPCPRILKYNSPDFLNGFR
jgi:hypothetical protein